MRYTICRNEKNEQTQSEFLVLISKFSLISEGIHLNCIALALESIQRLENETRYNGYTVTAKHHSTTQDGHSVSETPAFSSTQNQQSKKPPSTTPQSGEPISYKPSQGPPMFMIIVGITVTVVVILIIIIAVVLVICCILPRRRNQPAQKGKYVAVTVTGNDVTLTEPNGLIPNAQTTDQVEYADINPQSLVPKDDTGGHQKASGDASKALVYADLAFNNNNTTSGGKVDAVEQMHRAEMGEKDISQLYAKPVKKNK